jgi:hypothetical protein
MTTTTALSEIQTRLDAAIAALSPSHRHLYISSLILAAPILPPGVNSSGLPYQVKEALRLYREREAAIHAEIQQIEEKQRQESPLVATATEILTALIAANPDTNAKYLAADALAAARELHSQESNAKN